MAAHLQSRTVSIMQRSHRYNETSNSSTSRIFTLFIIIRNNVINTSLAHKSSTSDHSMNKWNYVDLCTVSMNYPMPTRRAAWPSTVQFNKRRFFHHRQQLEQSLQERCLVRFNQTLLSQQQWRRRGGRAPRGEGTPTITWYDHAKTIE
jgi:hypothetical protein